MFQIKWLRLDTVLSIHDEQVAEHGGLAGVRDAGLLESALSRPQLKSQYGETALSALAAAYAYGVARNHPFLDGNKRTAYVAMEAFLALNGSNFMASDEEAILIFLRLASGDMTEEALSAWINGHLRSRPSRTSP
jgi:death on curing protein